MRLTLASFLYEFFCVLFALDKYNFLYAKLKLKFDVSQRGKNGETALLKVANNKAIYRPQ